MACQKRTKNSQENVRASVCILFQPTCTSSNVTVNFKNTTPKIRHYTESKSKVSLICITVQYELLISKALRYGTCSIHSFTCHPHVYPPVARAIPAFTSQPRSLIALWLVLISHPSAGQEDKWAWMADYIPRQYNRKTKWSPILVLIGLNVE